MRFIGTPESWLEQFPDRLLPQIFEMVINVWEQFPSPKNDELENRITQRFCAALVRHKKALLLPFRIHREFTIDDNLEGQEKGRADIVLTYSNNEEEYFAFECKRLCLRDRTLGKAYVIDGMMRYVDGKYASGQDRGGMIAYVMDGNLSRALSTVNDNICRRGSELRIDSSASLRISSYIPDANQLKETRHHIDGRGFLIHHLFLPVRTQHPT